MIRAASIQDEFAHKLKITEYATATHKPGNLRQKLNNVDENQLLEKLDLLTDYIDNGSITRYDISFFSCYRFSLVHFIHPYLP